MSGGSALSGCERYLEETRDAPPGNLLVKFESFSLFSHHGIDKYEFRVFEARGYKWKMIMYPEGGESSQKEGCHVSVQFAIAETDALPEGWEVNAICAFLVYNHHLHNYLFFRGTTSRFNELVPKCGFTKLISKKTLIDPSKGYVVDDCCVFGAEVFVIKSQPMNECLRLVKCSAPFKFEWEIWGFTELGHVCKSEEFRAGNYKWKVKVNSGKRSLMPNDHYPSLCLECIDAKSFGPHRKVKAELCVRMKNKLNATHHSLGFSKWFTSTSRSCEFLEFISVENMKREGYLIDNRCFLDVEICVQAAVLDAPNFG